MTTSLPRRLLHAVRATLGLASLTASLVAWGDYPIFYQRYTADPSGLEHDGRMYLYASHDLDAQNSYLMNDITCMSTADLKNWTDHGECFKVAGTWAGLSWAPAVVERSGKFYMYFGNGGGGIGVAVSDSPAGPFKEARGKALADGSTPGVNPSAGMWLFDPGVVVDDDGKAYLFFGGNGPSNVRIIQLGADMISTVGSAVQLTAPHFFEDSWIHKLGGKFYFSYSTNWDNGAPTIDYMMSDSPMSGYKHVGTVLPQPPLNDNNNHHSIFKFKGNWYIAYHNRALAKLDGVDATYHRNLGLDRLSYNEDGTMAKTSITESGLTQLQPLEPYATVEAETMHREHGIETEDCTEGGGDVTAIENGDWIELAGVDFGGGQGATRFQARVASATSGGNIELRLDGPTGTLVGTCPVAGTGGKQTWATVSCEVSGATGVHSLDLVFTGASGKLFNLNWWKFERAASGDTTPPTAPGTPRASNLTASSVSLGWDASTDDVGVTGYAVYRHGASSDEIAASAGDTTAVVSGLTASTQYTFFVKATDGAGNWSAASPTVTIKTSDSGAGPVDASGGGSGASDASGGGGGGGSGPRSDGGSGGGGGGANVGGVVGCAAAASTGSAWWLALALAALGVARRAPEGSPGCRSRR
jgi:arabinoxylan arabinofuranohydrolase